MSNRDGRQLGFLIIPFGLVNNHPPTPLGSDKSLSVEMATKVTSYLSFTCPPLSLMWFGHLILLEGLFGRAVTRVQLLSEGPKIA